MSDRTQLPAVDPLALEHVLSLLQDALAEVDVWRQHAREGAELTALRRLAATLGGARDELRTALGASGQDPAQGSILEDLGRLRPAG